MRATVFSSAARLLVVGHCAATLQQPTTTRGAAVSPLHGLTPLAKPHYSYPPSAALLADPAAEVLLLDFIRLTGSLTPPSQEDPTSVHRTVQLYVHSLLVQSLRAFLSSLARLVCLLTPPSSSAGHAGSPGLRRQRRRERKRRSWPSGLAACPD